MRARAAILPIALSFLMLAYAIHAGISSGVSRSAANIRMYAFALTAVISSRDHGLAGHPYSGYEAVLTTLQLGGFTSMPEVLRRAGLQYPDNLRDYERLNAAIAAARSVNVDGSPLVMHAENDQGLTDYIRASFALFGEDVSSPYYFYFVLIALSMVLFVVEYWRSYEASALLFASVCGVYSFLPNYLGSDPELLTVATSRHLSTIGIIPLLHLILFMASGRTPARYLSLAALVLQSALIAFAFAIRATAEWMPIAVGAATLFYLARPMALAVRTRFGLEKIAPETMRRGFAALIFCASFAAVGAVREHSLEPTRGVALNIHPLWHNMFFGLSVNPEWRARFYPAYAGLRGDSLPFYAAAKYAVDHDLPYRTLPSIWIETPETKKLTSEPIPFGSWPIFERIVKAAFFEFVRAHPGYAIRVYFAYHPLALLQNLGDFLASLWLDLSWHQSGGLLLLLAIGAVTPRRLDDASTPAPGYRTVSAVTLLCLGVSTLPLLIVYSSPFLISDPACLMVAAIAILAMWAAQAGVAALRRRLRSDRIVAAS